MRRRTAQNGQAHAGKAHVVRADLRHRDDQAARHIAQQNGHEGAHFHHAVAPGELAIAQVLRQVGEFHRAKHGGL